jgi:prefoldin subunit 5
MKEYKITSDKNRYINIAINSLRENIELLDDELSDLTAEFENLYNERSELLKAVETLESFIDNDSDDFIY